MCRVPRQGLPCGVVQEDCVQVRAELLQLLPPKYASIEEAEPEILCISELLLESCGFTACLRFFSFDV